jgi:hypothetical protein
MLRATMLAEYVYTEGSRASSACTIYLAQIDSSLGSAVMLSAFMFMLVY